MHWEINVNLVLDEILRKKNFTVYPSLDILFLLTMIWVNTSFLMTHINYFLRNLNHVRKCTFCASRFAVWDLSSTASSSHKVSGFTEAVIKMNFWISHDLVHLIILSSKRRFCVYFWWAQAFHCFFHIWYILFLTKDGNKVILGLANFLLRKPLS